MGAVLRFPIQSQPHLQGSLLPPVPPLEELDPEKTRYLHGIAENIARGSRALVDFMDVHRDVARAAGIEAITVELSGIIDGHRLEPVTDELGESARLGKSSELSAEGFYYLTRAEKLLAQAQADLARYTGGTIAQPFVSKALGQANLPAPASTQDNTIIIIALAIIAIAIIALALK